MKDIGVLLHALPAIVLVGFTVYTKNIHEEMPKEHAVMAGLTYGALAAGFFRFGVSDKICRCRVCRLTRFHASQISVPMRPVTPSRR